MMGQECIHKHFLFVSLGWLNDSALEICEVGRSPSRHVGTIFLIDLALSSPGKGDERIVRLVPLDATEACRGFHAS